jgi:hypothetical protein
LDPTAVSHQWSGICTVRSSIKVIEAGRGEEGPFGDLPCQDLGSGEEAATMDWLFEPARMRFCEQTLAGPIKHPADAWTNVGLLVAGVWIFMSARRPLERCLGVAAVWTGIGSTIFHATDTILGEVLDLSGMFMFILTVAAMQQRRSSSLDEQGQEPRRPRRRKRFPFASDRQAIGVVVLQTGVLAVLAAYTTAFTTPAFGVLVALVALREVLSGVRLGRWALALAITFALAWGIWWLDYLKLLCYPSNHILTGHGVWHLLNALVFWFTFLHFSTAASQTQTNAQAPGLRRRPAWEQT